MRTSFSSLITLTTLCLITVSPDSRALTANPRISTGKQVATSSGDGSVLVNGKFGGSSWQVSAGAWFAIDIGKGPKELFLVWNNPNYSWSDDIAKEMSCKQGIQCPVEYTISVSEDSENGNDGTWTEKVTVTGNTVTARGHAIGFDGARWVKMTIKKGGGSIDEVEVFDASNGSEDTWFFAGTSISANVYKGTVVADNFSVLVNKSNSDFYPAMVRGGIPCILTKQFSDDIDKYIEAAGNCRYWAIEMGTNDGFNNGNANVATFKKNLQTVIDKCKEHDIQPVIARVLATNKAKAGWQIHDDYVAAVDELTGKNGLIAGPDFNAAAKENPDYLGDDGIHPSAAGSAALQKLWAEKMDSLYKAATPATAPDRSIKKKGNPLQIQLTRRGSVINISSLTPGTVSLFTLNGKLLQKVFVNGSTAIPCEKINRCILVGFTAGGRTTFRKHFR